MAPEATLLDAMEEARRRVPRVARELMRRHRVPGPELATALGMSASSLYARLNGKSEISSQEVAAFATYFGVPVTLFYLDPDDALRWVLDHPSEQGIRQSRWIAVSAGSAA